MLSLRDRWSWFVSGFQPHPVMLSSPHTDSECLRRLALATTQRTAASWYLDPRTAGRPEPRLRGDVGPSRIFVARFEDARGRNSFAPWLDGGLEPAVGGGSTLAGTIGLHPAVRRVLRLIAGVGALMAVIAVSAGTALLADGHLSGVPPMLILLVLAAFFVGLSVAGLRSLERDIPKLTDEVNGILDSIATLAGAAKS